MAGGRPLAETSSDPKIQQRRVKGRERARQYRLRQRRSHALIPQQRDGLQRGSQYAIEEPYSMRSEEENVAGALLSLRSNTANQGVGGAVDLLARQERYNSNNHAAWSKGNICPLCSTAIFADANLPLRGDLLPYGRCYPCRVDGSQRAQPPAHRQHDASEKPIAYRYGIRPQTWTPAIFGRSGRTSREGTNEDPPLYAGLARKAETSGSYSRGAIPDSDRAIICCCGGCGTDHLGARVTYRRPKHIRRARSEPPGSE